MMSILLGTARKNYEDALQEKKVGNLKGDVSLHWEACEE
jgi:hypothetical protein